MKIDKNLSRFSNKPKEQKKIEMSSTTYDEMLKKLEEELRFHISVYNKKFVG